MCVVSVNIVVRFYYVVVFFIICYYVFDDVFIDVYIVLCLNVSRFNKIVNCNWFCCVNNYVWFNIFSNYDIIFKVDMFSGYIDMI